MIYAQIENGEIVVVANIPDGSTIPESTPTVTYIELPNVPGASYDFYIRFAYIDGELVDVGMPPDRSIYTLDKTARAWVLDLGKLKATQWTAIKQARSAAEYAGFTWDGSTFDSDAISQNRITGAVALAQMSSTFSIGWVLADNTVRTLNQSDMLAVGAELGAHVAAQFAKGVLLREQIEAATTAEEVAVVVW